MFCKILENWLVVVDDFVCDASQLVNINRSTVNIPFSVLSIYYFPNTLSVLSYT